MGRTYDRLDERLRRWIGRQPVFFMATAPSGPGGHVNLSPKGHADTFAILDGRTVAYLDLTGSGAETVAHLRDNGCITLMLCAPSGPPRLYGNRRVVLPVLPGGRAMGRAGGAVPTRRGARAVVVVQVERIADSRGYVVPWYRHAGERDLLASGWPTGTTPPTAPGATPPASTTSLPCPRPR